VLPVGLGYRTPTYLPLSSPLFPSSRPLRDGSYIKECARSPFYTTSFIQLRQGSILISCPSLESMPEPIASLTPSHLSTSLSTESNNRHAAEMAELIGIVLATPRLDLVISCQGDRQHTTCLPPLELIHQRKWLTTPTRNPIYLKLPRLKLKSATTWKTTGIIRRFEFRN
jgi:hypothetical protein